MITPSEDGNEPFGVLRGGGQADLYPPFWIGLYHQHYQSYEWIGPGAEPLFPLTTAEPEPIIPQTTPRLGAESHTTSITARLRSLITRSGPEEAREETRPVASSESEADKGIWIDIRCCDPSLMSKLEALSLTLGDMVTITRRERSNIPVLDTSSISPPSLDTNANFADMSPVIVRLSGNSPTVSFMASSPVMAYSSAPWVSTPAFSSAVSPTFSTAVSSAIPPAVSPDTRISSIVPDVTSPLVSLADVASDSLSASPVTVQSAVSSTPILSLARGMSDFKLK